MKFSILILFAIFAISPNANSVDLKSKKAVIISIDALRPDFYLSPDFEAPTLKALIKKGTFSTGVTPVFPSVTYPNHSTIVTGASPAKHGILSNTQFDPAIGPQAEWYWFSKALAVPTLWDQAHRAGLKTSTVFWPVTVGAPTDWNVPEIFAKSDNPEDHWKLFLQYVDPSLLKEILKDQDHRQFLDAPGRDRFAVAAAITILDSKKPDVLFAHLANVDHDQHFEGPDSPLIKNSVKTADSQIAAILEHVDTTSTFIFIVGDHGFFSFTDTISPNTLFKQRGWIETEGAETKSWKVIAHTSGGQAAIYVKDHKLDAEVMQILKDNAGQAYRIIPKETLNQVGAYPDALCALTANEGFAMNTKSDGPLITKSSKVKGQHGYFPDNPKLNTGFIAVGPGIAAGVNLGNVNIRSVGPTIANKLKLVLPGAEAQPLF